MIQTVWMVVSLVIGVMAAVLAWRCNDESSLCTKLFISVYALFFGILYMGWYIIYQILWRRPTTTSETS